MDIDIASPRAARAARCDLPILPPAAALVSSALQNHTEAARVAAILRMEPALTAELLRAAHAQPFGRAGTYTVADAIQLVGWAETERIARLALASQTALRPELQSLLGQHWAHSLACAVAASQLAPYFGLPPERAFTYGILHDIGALGLMGASPEDYVRANRQRSSTCLEKLGAEQCILGMDHCKAGYWLVKSWGLPVEFNEVTALHHEMWEEGTYGVAGIVKLACQWADAMGFAVGHSHRISLRDAIQIAPPTVQPALKSASAKIERDCRARLAECAACLNHDASALLGL